MLYETDVDGVPALVAKTSGPLHAGLTFRVGRADETAARTGITHLIEHLALHRQGLTDYHFNGATGEVVTHFHMQGNEEDVVSFLGGVCQSLVDLPLDRLETEKSILRTEEAGRGRCANESMPLWRYGARGYGLLSLPEWGIHQLTPDDLQKWVATWFTRENAVFWVAGSDVPASLRLPLPSGTRRPVPEVTSALPVTPAFFVGSGNGVVFDTVVRRGVAASVYAGVLERELFRELRQDGGYSYTAAASYDTRGDGMATITALADAQPEQADAVLGGFIDALMRLKFGRIDPTDLTAVRNKAEESLRHPEVTASRLPMYAMNLLTGQPNRSVEAVRDELRGITVDDVHAVAEEVMRSALLMTPDGRTADWAGFTAAPTGSQTSPTGAWYVSRCDPHASLVIGPHEAGLITQREKVTIPYARCVAKLEWPDGARQLVGEDGLTLRVEPTLYHLQPGAIATLDANVPASAVVRMPAREQQAIPQPPAPTNPANGSGQPADAIQPARSRGWLEITTLVLLGVFVTLLSCAGLLGTAAFATMEDSDGGDWAVVGCVWITALIALLPMIVLLRRRSGKKG